jgi:WD40 repeat protein
MANDPEISKSLPPGPPPVQGEGTGRRFGSQRQRWMLGGLLAVIVGLVALVWHFASDANRPVQKVRNVPGKQESPVSAEVFATAGAGVPSIAFSHDGNQLASANRAGGLRLWDTSTRKPRDLYLPSEFGTKRLLAVAWNRDDTLIALAGENTTIAVWNMTKNQLHATLKGHKGRIPALAWHPDGKTLASASGDGLVKLWDADRGLELQSWRAGDTLLTLAWSGDGATIATAGDNATIQLWDAVKRQLHVELHGHAGILHDLAFSPDSKTLASASADGTLKLWDVSSGQLRTTCRGHQEGVTAVAWRPDGAQVASAAADSTVRLWNPASGQEQAILRGLPPMLACLSWSPDGTRLGISSFDSPAVWLWRPASK